MDEVTYSKSLHVLCDVTSEDVLSQGVGIEGFGLRIEARESVFGVRNVETTIRSTLHGTKHTGTSRGLVETNVQVTLEWAAGLAFLIVSSLSELVLSINFLNTSKSLMKSELGQSSAGKKKTGSIGSRPVGQTVLDSITLELVGVRSRENLVTNNLRSDNLTDDLKIVCQKLPA